MSIVLDIERLLVLPAGLGGWKRKKPITGGRKLSIKTKCQSLSMSPPITPSLQWLVIYHSVNHCMASEPARKPGGGHDMIFYTPHFHNFYTQASFPKATTARLRIGTFFSRATFIWRVQRPSIDQSLYPTPGPR